MTEHLQKHTDDRDGRLSLHADQLGTIVVATSKPSPSSLVGSGKRTGSIVTVPTSRLLAMIDTIDPDALRAYLREGSDLIDAPDESCSTLEDMLPADLAAEAARYRIDAVPEADSPEDVDERVPHREALLTDAQERRLYLIEQLTKTLPADESPALAQWIITGRADLSEDLTLSGDAL